MDSQETFTQWGQARGVKLNGIAAHRFPGRGLGIQAVKRIEVCKFNFNLVL